MSDAGRDWPTPKELSFVLSRRDLLLLAASLVTTTLHTAPQVAASDSASFEAFLSISRAVTGKNSLDRRLGRRLYDALVLSYPGFNKVIATLSRGANPSVLVDQESKRSSTDSSKTGELKLGAPEYPLAGVEADGARIDSIEGAQRHILRAWYLGLVGDSWAARAIAYEHALMYQPVADKVVLQTYCRGAPGYWAGKP